MKSIIKIILGATVRHWITGFLTILVTRHLLTAEMASHLPIDVAFSDDYIFDALMALVGAAIPALLAISSRLRAKLKERLALLLPALTTEREIKSMIAAAPLSTRISATLTANPDKIITAQSTS
jgi:hypothetical protein